MSTNYNDCEYTAFISYSSADSDLYDGGWAIRFGAEFKKKINAKLSRLPGGAKKSYLFENDPIISGDLTEKLETEISDSFVMVILVGEQYLESTVCLKECEYFVKNSNSKERLFIISLANSITKKLTNNWSRYININYTPAFIPFYSDDENNRPLKLYKTTSIGKPERNDQYEKILSLLVDKIALQINSNVNSSYKFPNPPQLPLQNDSTKILIGVTTEDLIEESESLKNLLLQNNLDVTLFSRKKFYRMRLDELSREYEKYAYLILIYSKYIPDMGIYGDGGHLKFQQDACLSDNKILWLSNKIQEIVDDDLATGNDLEYLSKIDALSNSYASKIDLLKELKSLTNMTSDKVFRLYIEKNNNEGTEWRLLGNRINKIWLCT